MKIGEVEIGTEVALANVRGRRPYRGTNPRRARVLDIVKETQKQYDGYTSKPREIQKRVVLVEVLGDPAVTNRYYSEAFERVPEGTQVRVEARYIVALWDDLKDEIKARLERKRQQEEALASLEARLTKILGVKSMDDANSWPTVEWRNNGLHLSVRMNGDELERVLALAEKGLEAS